MICVMIIMMQLIIFCAGAGVYAFPRTSSSDFKSRSIVNNSLIVSGSDGLRLECVSNSSQSGVGMITAYDEGTLPIGSNTGVWRLVNPFSRPGVLRLQTAGTSLMTSSDEGIYTCTIPDSNGNQLAINFGLYALNFSGEQRYCGTCAFTFSSLCHRSSIHLTQ